MKNFFSGAIKKSRILKFNIIIAIVLSVIISCVFFFIVFSSFKNESYSHIESSESSHTQRTATLFDNYLYQISLVAAKFYIAPNTYSYSFTQYDYTQEKYFKESIKNITDTMRYITDIDYLSKDNVAFEDTSYIYNDQCSIGKIGYTDVSYSKTKQWPYNLYFRYDNNKSIYKYNVLITVSPVSLGGLIWDNESPESKKMIVSNDGTVILSESDAFKENIFSIISRDKKNIKAGFFEGKFKGEDCFISVKKSSYIDAYSVMITPKSIYQEDINNVYLRTLLLTAGFFIVAVSICLFIAVKSYQPIKETLNTIKKYFPTDDNFEQFENETDYIRTHLSKTINTHEDTLASLKMNTELMYKAQINALQSQINPHFLFNTLEALKWLSIDMNGYANDIEKYIVMLEKIMRAGINNHINIIPFEEEIQLTKNYVNLMHLRYKNRFCVEYDIDEEIGSCTTIKFLLQPLVENCIKHGLSNIDSGGIIRIKAYSEDSLIYVIISDNGEGISEEKYLELKQKLSGPIEETGEHIGIYNVNARIKLLYGDAYGLTIENNSDGGVTCTICFPQE